MLLFVKSPPSWFGLALIAICFGSIKQMPAVSYALKHVQIHYYYLGYQPVCLKHFGQQNRDILTCGCVRVSDR